MAVKQRNNSEFYLHQEELKLKKEKLDAKAKSTYPSFGVMFAMNPTLDLSSNDSDEDFVIRPHTKSKIK